MQNNDFCHLHLHTTHSSFDGYNNIKSVVKKAKEYGHTAIGITDHGTDSGIIQFIKACRSEDIKPIVGMEAYLARNMHDKNTDGRKGNRHINIFAKNLEGYKNLCRLSQKASLEGFYHSGRIDIELLAQHSEGLIVSTACLSNIVNWNLKIDRYDKAKQAATIFKDIFKDDFYLEIMYHGMDDEANIIPGVQKLSKELGVKIIVSNDAHYCNKEDAAVHDVVLCLGQRGTCIRNPNRLKFPGKEFYYKSTEEMYKIFKHIPSSMKNTMEIAEKCDLSGLKFGGMNLPKYSVPELYTDTFDYLKHLAWKGLKERGLDQKQEYVDRLNLEISDVELVINQNLRFDVYFLIVLDIVNFIREKNIPYGIRGSGNGSLLLYCLKISRVDPLKYCGGLFWTRFLGFDWVQKIDFSDFGIKANANESTANNTKLQPVEIARNIIPIIKQHKEYNAAIVKSEITQLIDFGIGEISHTHSLIASGNKSAGYENKLNSWVAYLLGITTEKPTGKFAIPKKRVYARPGWPDIDIDICTERRFEVVEYCIQKYGRENVGNIGTIGLLKVASAIRRAVQVLDPEQIYNDSNDWGGKLSPDPNNALRNAISDTLPTIMKDKDGNIINSLSKAYEEYPEFREYMDQYPDVYEVAKELEEHAVIQSKGVHAAGFVLSPVPMADICPLHVTKRVKGEIEEIATQFTMEDVESLGLIKMDLLGLSTETAIARTIRLVEENYGIKLDFDVMERNDKATFDLLSSGNTVGVFQCENGGMQETLRKIGVKSIEDIAICIAMYRPGPMQYIDELADRKHGRKKIVYDHPVLEEIAKWTYGLYCFQEQTMSLFVKMAGLTETDGYKFIKGCSKKKKDIVVSMMDKFVKSCLKNGVDSNLAKKTGQALERWAGYGFNLGHATGYAVNETYCSAYLKVHFPAEFMASQLSVEYRRKTDKLMKMYRQEVKRMGFTILPPDINRSGIDWEIVDKKTLLEPLIVKGIGIKAASEIIACRPYDNDDLLYNFVKKIYKDRQKPSNVDKDVVSYMWEAGMWPQFPKKEALISKFDVIASDIRKGRVNTGFDLFAKKHA